VAPVANDGTVEASGPSPLVFRSHQRIPKSA
jgi:hypothetical protein